MPILLALPSSTKFSTALPRSGGQDADSPDLRFFTIKTPLANVSGAHITRNYRWWTAFGVRGSMADDGLSFGTNHNAGVCIHFAEKVPSPLRRSGHSALTVTVADLEGLVSALGAEHSEASSASPP